MYFRLEEPDFIIEKIKIENKRISVLSLDNYKTSDTRFRSNRLKKKKKKSWKKNISLYQN